MEWKDYVKGVGSENGSASLSIHFSYPNLSESQPNFFTKLNSKLVDDMLLLENNRIVFCYPDCDGFVLSLALYRHIARIVSGDTAMGEVDLHPGDKIWIGQAVAEVIDISEINGEMRVRFGNKADKNKRCLLWTVEKLKYALKAPSEAKVSSYPAIERQAQVFKQKIRPSDNPSTVEELRRRRGAVVPITVLISNTNGLNDLVENLYIDGERISDVMAVARVKPDGSLASFGPAATNPELVIASNPERAYSFISSFEGKVDCVYVDLSSFTNIGEFVDAIGALAEEFSFPIIFFKPENSSLDINSLFEIGFREFIWTPAMVYPQLDLGVEDCCNSSIEAYAKKEIKPFNVENPPIADLLNELMEIQQETQDDENYNITDAIAILIRYCFALIRQCAGFDPEVQISMLSRGDTVFKTLLSEEVFRFLPDKSRANRLNEIWRIIRKEIEEAYPLKKIELCGGLLRQAELGGKKICLIVTDDTDIDQVTSDLKGELDGECVSLALEVVTYTQYIGGFSHYDVAIVCGWLGKEKMKRLLIGNKARVFIPLLYDFEIDWMKPSVNAWANEIKPTDINGLIWDLSNDSMPNYHLAAESSLLRLHNNPVTPNTGGEDYESILKKVRDLQWHGYTKAYPGEEMRSGRHVSFSDGSYGVFSLNYTFSRIPDDDEKSLESADIDNLCVGDVLIFGDSDHDLLVEESTKLLASEGNGDALGYAGLWKSSIATAKMIGMSDEDIIGAFKEAGLVRSDCLFRQWLNDECNIICPAKMEDIKRIGKALNDDLLVETAEDVFIHAKLVYSARIRTGRSLMKKLLEDINVANAIAHLRRNSEFVDSKYIVDIAGIGKVRLVAVSEIGEAEQYPSRIINQLRSFYG